MLYKKLKKIFTAKFFVSMLLGPIVPVLFADTDNVENEVKFGGTWMSLDNEIIAKITSFNKNTSIKEENITGSEDIIPGTNVLYEKFTPISVGETATLECIVIESSQYGPDDGQSDFKDAASKGIIVTISCVKNTGYGWALTGFFTSKDEGADTSGVYKLKGTFRINTKVAITPGS